jgi:hypothetical protein
MTTPSEFRCSTFALDLHWASRGSPVSELGTHLAQCVRCRAYLAELEALDALRPAMPPPGRTARVERGGAHLRTRLAVGASGLALAAGVFLFLQRTHDASEGEYLGTKGTPSVQLIVHRAGSTTIWDGRAPVRPGDALAFRVACEGLSHVAIAAPGGTGADWTRLKDADCPADATPLPFTLVIDEEPADERFAVVLSREPLGDPALASAAKGTERSAGVWTLRFDLAKVAELQ